MSSLNRKGKNVLDHSLTVRRGNIVIDQGGVSGSATSTGSFGQLDAKSISTTTATLISGSFNASAISASFALTKAVTGSFALKKAVTGSFALKKAVSGSFPLKTAISGSFTELSTSLASRIAAEETEAEGTVVSSSAQIATDISGSFNKSAVSASFALKKAVTGSFALKSAVSASFAQKSAVSASFAQSTAVTASLRSYVLGAALSGSTALVSGSKISTGSFGRVEVGQININGITGIISASYVGMEGGSRFKHSQSLASTWTINHNLNEQYPNITVYNADDEMILPTTVTATDVDTTTLTFSTPVSGHAMVSTGGHSILEGAAGNTRHSQTVAATNWRVTHSLGEQYPSITVYDGDDNVIIPERISATNARNMDIFFTDPTTGTAFVTIGSGTSTTVISSSAQFADDISGSWSQQGVITSSAQIATDISGSLGSNATLIRSLTAVGVSGSFTELSTSLASRIAAEEVEAEGTVVSSSAQIASDISGSLGTNATLIRSLTAAAISGSVVAGVSGSALSTGSFGKLEVGGNSSFTGDLTVGGRLTAQEFHTEFVSSSIMFQSGSTKFGDSAADTHTFTGKMEISGSQAKVSASVGATGSFGHLFLAKGGHVTDRLYFSDVGGEYISGDGTDLNITSGNDINIPADIGLTFGNDGEKIEGNGTRLSISSGTGLVLDSEGDIEINADGGDIDFKDDTAPLLKISATAISGSVTSTGSFGSIYVDKNVNASAFVGDGSAISGLISAADISGSLGTNAALIRSLTATTITGSSAAKATPGFSIAMSVAL